MALTALAGPLSNIIFAAFMMFLFGFLFIPLAGSATGVTVIEIIYNIIYINIALAVFNMLPLPPLDGSKVVFSLLPDKAYNKVIRYERFGMIVLLGIVGFQMLFNSYLNTWLNLDFEINVFRFLIERPVEAIFSFLGHLFNFSFGLVN